jgi:hypothetical protein
MKERKLGMRNFKSKEKKMSKKNKFKKNKKTLAIKKLLI